MTVLSLAETLRGLSLNVAEALNMDIWMFRASLAVLLVSLVCGMVGALVVGNRMAFFSNAMSHCAFAGVALGLLTAILFGAAEDQGLIDWLVPLVMVLFAVLVGAGIAFVRERTNLPADTVIGVFFAGTIGFGALLLRGLSTTSYFNPEAFLFGNLMTVVDIDLLYLLALLLITLWFLFSRYNQLVFASFQPSLARSRGVPGRLNDYLFIVLLALIVNFSFRSVGILLINGILIVPAATASNLARNMRQLFWWTVLLSVITGAVGLWLSTVIEIPLGLGQPIVPGPSSVILLLMVFAFFVSILWRQLAHGWR